MMVATRKRRTTVLIKRRLGVDAMKIEVMFCVVGDAGVVVEVRREA